MHTLSRDNANEDLWQTNKHTDRQGWNSMLKWRIGLFLIPWMRSKRLIWKKNLKRIPKTAVISIYVIKTTGKLRASIQIFYLLCPAQSIEWICTSWCFLYVLITQIHFFRPCIIRFFWAYNKTKTYSIIFILCE